MKKYLFITIVFILFAFKADKNKSIYSIPENAFSVTTGDIDLDGDNDIVVGHRIMVGQDSPIITILDNYQNGIFEIADTIKSFYGYQYNVLLAKINDDEYPDIISLRVKDVEGVGQRYIRILYNSNGAFTTYKDFSLNTSEPISDVNCGDVNGDGYIDIVFMSYRGKFWGVLYNDGIGNFSIPEYHITEGYSPHAISCNDINNDGRDDIVICGQETEVFYSYANGFNKIRLNPIVFRDQVCISDFNNDGKNDLLTLWGIAAGAEISSFIFYKNIGNDSLEELEEIVLDIYSSEFHVRDFNNDGFKDILFETGMYKGFTIYYGDGSFQLQNPQFIPLPAEEPKEPWRKSYCADMDNNGYQDIITVKTLEYSVPNNLEILYNNGNGEFIQNPVSGISNIITNKNQLSAYPNPFNTQTTLEFTVDTPSLVELNIFNLQGKWIYSMDEEKYLGGIHTIKWNGYDSCGNYCESGVYIAHLRVNSKTQKYVKLIKLK